MRQVTQHSCRRHWVSIRRIIDEETEELFPFDDIDDPEAFGVFQRGEKQCMQRLFAFVAIREGVKENRAFEENVHEHGRGF